VQPISVQIPWEAGEAVAAEVTRPPAFDGSTPAAVVRVWIGAAFELVMSGPTADRLADALVDAIATDDEQHPVLFPPKTW
jgi:hypothetical protein